MEQAPSPPPARSPRSSLVSAFSEAAMAVYATAATSPANSLSTHNNNNNNKHRSLSWAAGGGVATNQHEAVFTETPQQPSKRRRSSSLRRNSHRISIASSSKISSITRDSYSSEYSASSFVADAAYSEWMLQSPHLYGRSHPQHVLQTVFLNALKSSANAQLVSVLAPPGLGKTALLADFGQAVAASGTGYYCTGVYQRHPVVSKSTLTASSSLLPKHSHHSTLSTTTTTTPTTLLPCSPLLDAFQQLVATAKQKRDDDRIKIKSLLKRSQASHAHPQIFCQTIQHVPALYDLLGMAQPQEQDRQPPQQAPGSSSALSMDQDVPLLLMIFRQVLRLVAVPGNPVIISLDNLQYADTATFDFLATLLDSASAITNVVVLVALRNDLKLPSGWQLLLSKQEQQSSLSFQQILLEPLSPDAVAELVSDLTSSHGEATDGLAKIAWDHTGGNPQSLVQYLQVLQRSQLLVYSFHAHKWKWKLSEIREYTRLHLDKPDASLSWQDLVQDLTSNVQDVLTVAACIGVKWDARILQDVALRLHLWDDKFQAEMDQALQSVVQECLNDGIIHRGQLEAVVQSQVVHVDDESSIRLAFYEDLMDDAIHMAVRKTLLLELKSENALLFASPEIHQYFYQRGKVLDKSALHFEIGKTMHSVYQWRPEETRMLLAAVDHLGRAVHQCRADPTGRIVYMELFCRTAGLAQQEATVQHRTVAQRANHGLELAMESDWEAQRDLLTELYSMSCLASYKIGNYKECMAAYAALKKHSPTPMLLPHALSFAYVQSLMAQGEYEYAILCCTRVLRSLNEFLPAHITNFAVRRKVHKTLRLWRQSNNLENRTLARSERVQVTMDFYQSLGMIALAAGKSNLFQWVHARMVRYLLFNGICEQASAALMGFAVVCVWRGRIVEAAHLGKVALQIGEDYPQSRSTLLAKWLAAVYLDRFQEWEEGSKAPRDPLLKVSKEALAMEEYDVLSCIATWRAAQLLLCGIMPLKAYREDVAGNLERLGQVELISAKLDSLDVYHNASIALWGHSVATKDRQTSEENALGDTTTLSYFHGSLVPCFLAYMEKDTTATERLLPCLKKALKDCFAMQASMLYPVALFLYGAASAMLYNEHRYSVYWRQLKHAKRELKQLMAHRTDCKGFWLFLKGQCQPLGCADQQGFLQQAAHIFEAFGWWSWQGVTYEQCAMSAVAAAREDPAGDGMAIAETYLRKALKVYTQWGALSKCTVLREQVRSIAARNLEDVESSSSILWGDSTGGKGGTGTGGDSSLMGATTGYGHASSMESRDGDVLSTQVLYGSR